MQISQAFRTMHRKPSQAFWELSGRFPDLCGKYLYDFVGQGQPTERMLKISGHSLFTRGSFVGSEFLSIGPKVIFP